MKNTKVFLFLILIATALSQDDAAKSRFDKILQDFGFSAISKDRTTKLKIEDERRGTVSSGLVSSEGGKSQNIKIQSNIVHEVETKAPKGKQVESSGALAALFSIAGRPRKTKIDVIKNEIENSSPNINANQPVARTLKDRSKTDNSPR